MKKELLISLIILSLIIPAISASDLFTEEENTRVVGRAFRNEVNFKFLPVKSYVGGDIIGEKLETTPGSFQHSESEIDHDYSNFLYPIFKGNHVIEILRRLNNPDDSQNSDDSDVKDSP